MKALNDYVEGRNRIRALFKDRPLSLDNAQDRQQLADDISCSLSPENLTNDACERTSSMDCTDLAKIAPRVLSITS